MIREIWFTIKVLALTIVLVLVLQIHVGTRTLESRASSFLQSSPVTFFVQKAATGAVKLSKDSYHRLLHRLSNHPVHSAH